MYLQQCRAALSFFTLLFQIVLSVCFLQSCFHLLWSVRGMPCMCVLWCWSPEKCVVPPHLLASFPNISSLNHTPWWSQLKFQCNLHKCWTRSCMLNCHNDLQLWFSYLLLLNMFFLILVCGFFFPFLHCTWTGTVQTQIRTMFRPDCQKRGMYIC